MPGRIETAVATREAGAPAQVTRSTYIKKVIERQAKRLAAVSPKGFDSERFAHLVITAVKATPQLMDCFNPDYPAGELSVLLAAMQAAEVGLEPNTPLQHCWLLPRRKKVGNDYQTECQLSIGYRGYIELAERSDRVQTIYAEVVREGDEFRWGRSLEADILDWTPAPSDQRGALTHAFAVVRKTNGGRNFVVLDRAAIEDRRSRSDSWKSDRSRPFSPWTTAEESMWRKSAVRALVPYLPLSSAVASFVGADDSTLGLSDDGDEIIPANYVAEQPDAIEAGESV